MAALERFTEKQSLTFPLASDPDHEILEAYGAWGEKNPGRGVKENLKPCAYK